MCAQTHIDVATESAFPRCVPGQHLRVGSGWRHAAVWLAGGIIVAPHINSTQSQRSTDAAAAAWPPNTPDIPSLRAQGDSFPLNYAGKKKMRDDFHQCKIASACSTCSQYIKAIFYIKAEGPMRKCYSCELAVSTWRQVGSFPLLVVFCRGFQGRALRHQWTTGAVELKRVVVGCRIKRQRVESWETQTKRSLITAQAVKALDQRAKRWET